MNIGFIGLGSMGRPMALNLVEAGHRVGVHDIDRGGIGARDLLEAGARWADSPAEAARKAEVIFTSLPGPREVEAVALGADCVLDGAPSGSVYIDLSTSSPTLARRIYKTYREKGIDALDAPVSQGTARAKYEGTLSIMVGGDEAVFKRMELVLGILGHDRLIYCGESGAGDICKIVNNFMLFAIQTSMAEALTLGVRSGVPVETIARVISQSSGKSVVGDGMYRGLEKPRSFDIDGPDGFSLILARKDVRLATDLGRELDVPLEIANIVEQKLTAGVARGWGHRAHSAHILLQEERAGVELRSQEQSRLQEAGEGS